jgi:hypothetical protein
MSCFGFNHLGFHHRDASCRLADVQRQTEHLMCRRIATAG